MIKHEWKVSQKLQEDSAQEFLHHAKKRRAAEADPAKPKAKAKAQSKMTSKDSPCVDAKELRAAEVASTKTITFVSSFYGNGGGVGRSNWFRS